MDAYIGILLTVGKTVLALLIQILPVTFVALFGTELLMQLGLMKKLTPIGAPLTRLSRLPAISTVTFITGMGSVLAANSMLAAYRNDGLINDRELVLSALLNSIPVYIRELITYHFPVVFPLLGLWVGTIYLMTFWLAGFMRIVFIVVIGRWLLEGIQQGGAGPPVSPSSESREGTPKRMSFRRLLLSAFNSQIRLFLRISSNTAIVMFGVLLLMELGFFQWTDALIGPMVERVGLPSSVLGPLSIYAVNPLVGLASISTMLQSHQISDHQAIVALLIGGLVMIPLIYLRSMLPNYAIIFGARLGTLIVLLSMGFALLARLIILGITVAGS